MSRRRVIAKRVILPDPKYGDQTLAKFINVLMLNGKKSVAERIVYGALDQVAKRTKGDPLETFGQALDNVRPVVRLANELMDAANSRGAAVKKREDTHRMAEANKAFAHYRW